MSTSSLVQPRSTHRVDAHVSIIDGLISQPLLEESSRPGTSGRCSGPGFHVAVFHESRDFWDDRSTEIAQAAGREREADLAALSASSRAAGRTADG
ncbi:hypothetical protein AB0O05_14595 [Streptomyces sp. NPDC093084]|uniref:hypothetical protein n=1 Tax=Streptomyces sp. NPDC093084 TaxID=3155197 RepID=UPI00341511E2